jgi:uncharacterized damage-inducible protein DinB
MSATPTLTHHLATHHRGQVHAMLAGASVKPLQLDEFFCADDVPLHADDFVQLGYTEQMIWGS